MSNNSAPSKGDWVCSDSRCGNLNFSRRDKCNKCGKARKLQFGRRDSPKEIGKDFAEKSRGLFSPDDWQCKSCGNVNWARRTVCNVCNSTKVNKQGQRTGYGGGYMERDEVVDYKPHDDSDDEFDEFGLKKKKFRKIQGNGDGDHESAIEKQSGGGTGKAEESKVESGQKNKKIEQEKGEDEEVDEEESGDDNDLSKYDIWGDDDKDEEAVKKKEGVDESSRSSEDESSSSDSSSSSSSSSSSTSSSRSASAESPGSQKETPAQRNDDEGNFKKK